MLFEEEIISLSQGLHKVPKGCYGIKRFFQALFKTFETFFSNRISKNWNMFELFLKQIRSYAM
jgi:hypothetical protein